MDRFSSACDNFGLTISTIKTEVMHQTAPGKPYHEQCVTVKGHKLQAVDRSTYLGSTLSTSQQQDCQSQCSLWTTEKECMGVQKTQYNHQAEGLSRCGFHYTPTCL